MSHRPIRLCRIVTVPMTFQMLFKGQLLYLAQHGFEITLVSHPGPELAEVARDLGIQCHPIEMMRDPSPWYDLKSLVALVLWLRTQSFDVIHSSTPKAGLLAALAGWLCRVPTRVHTYTGQVWVEMYGPARAIVKAMDKIVGFCTTACLTDSPSQQRLLVEEGIVRASKITVLGPGSVAGVDLDRFNLKRWAPGRSALRVALNIAPAACAIAYVGRLRADKGINELVDAFQRLQIQGLNVDLMLIGPPEYTREPLRPETMQALQTNARIHVTGYTVEPERYLSAADLFVLPSYREGFGTSIIEAAAMGLPAVATLVTGCVDAVVDGETGLLVPPKDASALAAALARLVEDNQLRKKLGHAACARAVSEFNAHRINRMVAEKLEQMAKTSC